MANLTVTITPAQETRIRKAMGVILNEDGSPASEAQVESWIKRQLRTAVLNSELRAVAADVEITKRAELKAEGW